MNAIFAWLAASLILLHYSASSYSISYMSQHRLSNEQFHQALGRVQQNLVHHHLLSKSVPDTDSPVYKKTPIANLDYRQVPIITHYQDMMNMFYLIRDRRFMYLNKNPDFARRISWLYPDDGCFARAALSNIKIQETYAIRPAKIFAFGELEIPTQYSKEGYVDWWFHMAAIVSYNDSYYVLDPALNDKAPLLVNEWFSLMGHSENLEGVICNSFTYHPFDGCFKATEKSDAEAQNDQSLFLKYEWKRMLSLKFDPLLILGDYPPWLF